MCTMTFLGECAPIIHTLLHVCAVVHGNCHRLSILSSKFVAIHEVRDYNITVKLQ